ncbi:hypothetical protein FQN54_008466 [Arachnomyces sp. PD_36]|nr:hypothetical protein FQN54_008466 [Arachnomyces sp. PD_36]
MASVASGSLPTPAGMIDPTKQAEYPILLGDKLLGKESAKKDRLVSIKYNHKAKAAPQLQKSTITPSANSQDVFKLTVQDKSSNADNAASIYRGSVDPESLLSDGDSNHLVLVFDPKRKAFILEPVSTQLHFNLRSAPGKSNKQVAEQYPQLDILAEDDHASSDDELGAPDSENPYDFRHFLPKAKPDTENTASTSTTPESHPIPKKPATSTPSTTGAKPKPKPAPKPKAQPPPEKKRPQKPATKDTTSTNKPKPAKPAPQVAPEEVAEESAQSDGDESFSEDDSNNKPDDAGASPNIIVDGDLIIDMGSPPPSRPAIKINPRYFSSNNTSANEADDDDEEDGDGDIDELDPPLPPGALRNNTGDENMEVDDADEEDDDALAAEMERAFEEEARNQQMQQYQQPQYDDSSESEVSEEE